MKVTNKINEAALILLSLMVIGFIGLIFLMVFGNLSGNLGFTSGTENYNLTEGVINNLSGGASTFFGFADTWFTIVAIVVLITMLLGLLYIAVSVLKAFKGKSGFSGG